MNISVIIPVYNDPEGLRDTLKSLVKQDFDGRYEVLPVDNNSTDATAEVIFEFEEDYPDLVKGLEEKEIQSSYAARNKGVKESKGDILCFVDADMIVPEDYLSRIYEKLNSKEEIYYMGCRVELFSDADSLASRYEKAMAFHSDKNIEGNNFVPTCCLTVRRELIDDVGLFDKRMLSGGDVIFGNKVSESDYDLHYDQDIILKHPARSSLKELWKKKKRVGRGMNQMQRYHPDLGVSRSPFDLRNFLPPHPRNFFEKCRSRKVENNTEILKFYFVAWALKYGRTYGQIKEYLGHLFS